MKQPVRPKKALGQHFLTDQGVAQAIVAALRSRGPCWKSVREPAS